MQHARMWAGLDGACTRLPRCHCWWLACGCCLGPEPQPAWSLNPLQGNCLLVGVGGSGKQSLARLAASAAGCEVFEISLSRGYDTSAFRTDLKALYGKLGMENKQVQGAAGAGGKGRQLHGSWRAGAWAKLAAPPPPSTRTHSPPKLGPPRLSACITDCRWPSCSRMLTWWRRASWS